MTRLDRLNAILLKLRSKRVIRGEEIAEEFQISLRTVYRDIKSLMESGVPIYSEAGYGYSLDQDYSLKPVRLTDSEASALLLGAEFVVSTTDKSVQSSAKTALQKIQAILTEDARDYVERLNERLLLRRGNSSTFNGYRDDVMDNMHQAIVKQLRLQIRYYSKHREEFSSRTIEPLGLFFNYNNWHVAAYCTWRKDYRDFRIDRIQELEILHGQFQDHHDFSLSKFLDQQFQSNETSKIRAVFNKETAKRLKEKHYFQYSTESEIGDSVCFEFHAPVVDWLVTWFLSFGESCKVLEPKVLRNMIKEKAQLIINKY